MGKSRVIFHKVTGTVLGVLRKDELPLFDAQRGLENYHIVKMNDDELNDAFEYLDLGIYVPIYYDDLIVFPHEEFGLIEVADSHVQYYVNTTMPKAIKRITETLRFDDEENALVRTALGTTLNIYGQIVDMELNAEDSLNYRDYMLNIMKEFDVKDDYK